MSTCAMRRVAAMRWQEYATDVRAGQEKGGEIPALFPPQSPQERAPALADSADAGNLRGVGDHDLDPAVLLAPRRGVIAGHRSSFTLAYRNNALGRNALGYQCSLHRFGAILRQLLIEAVRTHAVGMT